MNYELAKELKEAGFPQGKTRENEYPLYVSGGAIPWREGVDKTPEGTSEYAKIPTLSELIEVCGGGFWELGKKPLGELSPHYGKEWKAVGFSGKAGEQIMHEVHAYSPEEAVARLWLALNKK